MPPETACDGDVERLVVRDLPAAALLRAEWSHAAIERARPGGALPRRRRHPGATDADDPRRIASASLAPFVAVVGRRLLPWLVPAPLDVVKAVEDRRPGSQSAGGRSISRRPSCSSRSGG